MPCHRRNDPSAARTPRVGSGRLSAPSWMSVMLTSLCHWIFGKASTNLSAGEILSALHGKSTLMAIYHPAVHITPAPAPSDEDSEPASWGRSRDVLGYYIGRRNEVLAPRSDGQAQLRASRLGSAGRLQPHGTFSRRTAVFRGWHRRDIRFVLRRLFVQCRRSPATCM